VNYRPISRTKLKQSANDSVYKEISGILNERRREAAPENGRTSNIYDHCDNMLEELNQFKHLQNETMTTSFDQSPNNDTSFKDPSPMSDQKNQMLDQKAPQRASNQ